MYHRRTSPWLVCLSAFVLTIARASAAEPLTRARAVQLAVERSPEVAADHLEAEAAAARASREGLGSPWIVSADLENFAGSGALTGMDAAESTLRLGRTLELGGKRTARQGLGAADVARRRHETQVSRLRVAALAETRFIEVLADQQRLQLAERHVELAQSARTEVARWVQAARNPETDLFAAELALADAELEREHAEHELASARVTLASTWGSRQPEFESAAGSLAELPEAPSLELLAKRLPESATQRGHVLDAEVAAGRRTLAQANAHPDLTMNLGVRRLEAFDEHGLVLSASVPLGSRSRASLSASEADAQIAATAQRQSASIADTWQAVYEKYQELLHARAEHTALREVMLPKSEQALNLAQRGFDSGRFSFAALTLAQNTSFTLRRRAIDAAARYHSLLVEVERLAAVIPEPTP
jgi:cobalt-zinc-cadmium efflux system outer membrane protein